MEASIQQAIKRKKDIAERIEENRKLIQLLQNPGIRQQEITPVLTFKKHFAARRIQTYWRKLQKRLAAKSKGNKQVYDEAETLIYNLSAESNRTKTLAVKSGNFNIIDFILKTSQIKKIIKLQRRWKAVLKRRGSNYIRSKYTKNFAESILEGLKHERNHEIRNEIVQTMKSQDHTYLGTAESQERLTESYFYAYYNFNEQFPYHLDQKISNWALINQTLEQIELLKNNEEISSNFKTPIIKQTQLYYDSQQVREAKTDVDKILNDMEKNVNRHKFEMHDDFEQRLLINEIDSLYNFSNFEDIIYN